MFSEEISLSVRGDMFEIKSRSDGLVDILVNGNKVITINQDTLPTFKTELNELVTKFLARFTEVSGKKSNEPYGDDLPSDEVDDESPF